MRRFNFFLSEDQIEFLEKLPGTISENIRRAIDEYIERKRGLNVSSSQSKRVGE